MPSMLFSIPAGLARVGKTLGAAADGDVAGQAPLLAEWRTAAGAALGDKFELPQPATTRLEYPDATGRMGSMPANLPLTFASEPPDGAASLALSSGGAEVGAIARGALFAAPAALPQPKIVRVGDANPSFVLPVIAERFTDQDDFMTHVQALRQWVVTQPPFDQEATASKLAFDGYFWPSDPVNGLFNSNDSQCQPNRLFYGDRVLAKQLLDPWIPQAKVSVILIDSTLRGGAGGTPGYSAWTSIAAAPGEYWEAICLHEVGHGLGLADEYLDDTRADEMPAVLEPNISANSLPSQAPWSGLVTLPDNPAPSFPISGSNPPPAGSIGTFQGARYRTDLYRATDTCLMQTTTQPFCPVCQAHILATL